MTECRVFDENALASVKIFAFTIRNRRHQLFRGRILVPLGRIFHDLVKLILRAAAVNVVGDRVFLANMDFRMRRGRN